MAELGRSETEVAPTMGTHKPSIDLCDTPHANTSGIRALSNISFKTAAEFVPGLPWTKYIAYEIKRQIAL